MNVYSPWLNSYRVLTDILFEPIADQDTLAPMMLCFESHV